jgi:hypothetical protein
MNRARGVSVNPRFSADELAYDSDDDEIHANHSYSTDRN